MQSDGVTIDYANNEEGMRQNFFITDRPVGLDVLVLDLVVESQELELRVNTLENYVYLVSKSLGEEVLRYSSLKVWDANQREILAQMVPDGPSRFAIVVNDSDAVYPVTIDPLTAVVYKTGDQASAKFGYAVAPLGDVRSNFEQDFNGGFIVGAPNYDDGQTDEGKVFVFEAQYPNENPSSTPSWTAQINQDYAHLGKAVAGYFNVDGDAYGDIMVGVPDYDSDGLSNNGRVFFWKGSNTGLPGGASGGTESNASWIRAGTQSGEAFGFSLAAARIRGTDQSYWDIIVGSPYYDASGVLNVGKAYVYNGSSSGPSASPDWTKIGTWTGTYGSWFGHSVANALTLDGSTDTYEDILIGAPYADSGGVLYGRVYIFLGSGTGLPTNPNQTLTGSTDWSEFGFSVAGANDVDGNGYLDIIVGAPHDDNGQTDEGIVYVYYRSSTGFPSTASWTAESNQAGAQFGYSVTGGLFSRTASGSPGTVDAYGDVIVGAPFYDTTGYSNNGSAFFWFGSSTGLGASGTPSNADWQVLALSNDAHTGWSVSYARSYGYSSPTGVAVGTPNLDGSGFFSAFRHDP